MGIERYENNRQQSTTFWQCFQHSCSIIVACIRKNYYTANACIIVKYPLTY
uniref:Uncharacterized protein n=1 Tax=Anguilla anguilla TaxID=7936 RepID=A0A0E9SCL2_ANGAN